MSYAAVPTYGVAAGPPSGHSVNFDPTIPAYEIVFAASAGTLAAPGTTGTPTSVSLAGLTRDQLRQLGQFLLEVAD